MINGYRVDSHGSIARCKGAEIVLDTDLAGGADAFNPADLLLAALAACMIKGIERVAPVIRFQCRGVKVRLHGVRQNVLPRMSCNEYKIMEIMIDTDGSDQRLAIFDDNMRKYGTVFNTVATRTEITGTLRRAAALNQSALARCNTE